MAIILKVSPDKLLSTAAELESQGSTMKTYTDQMVNLVNEQDDIARIHKMVQEHVQDLQDIARNYTEAETANQEIANSLSSDVIV